MKRKGTVKHVVNFNNYNFLEQSSIRTVHPKDKHGPLEIKVKTTLPPYVLPYYWEKFEMSMEDILLQATDIPAKLYWIAAILCGVDVSKSALKPSLSSLEGISMCGKPTAISKILKWSELKLANNTVVSSHLSGKHIPPFPMVSFPPMDFQRMKKDASEHRKQKLIQWKKWEFLCCGFEGDNILFNRIVDIEEFKASKRARQSGFAAKPEVVNCSDRSIALAEESFLAVCMDKSDTLVCTS